MQICYTASGFQVIDAYFNKCLHAKINAVWWHVKFILVPLSWIFLLNIPNFTFPFDEVLFWMDIDLQKQNTVINIWNRLYIKEIFVFSIAITQVSQKLFGNAVYFYSVCLNGTQLLKKLYTEKVHKSAFPCFFNIFFDHSTYFADFYKVSQKLKYSK